MKDSEIGRRRGRLDSRLGEFDRRLRELLGEGRIPRREKRAKAEQAIQLVDDLIEGITEDAGQIEESK